MRCVRWESYEPNVLPFQHSHHLLLNVRKTVMTGKNAGKIIEMHRLARGIEIFENKFSGIFIEIGRVT
jgi:hypothetical protein